MWLHFTRTQYRPNVFKVFSFSFHHTVHVPFICLQTIWTLTLSSLGTLCHDHGIVTSAEPVYQTTNHHWAVYYVGYWPSVWSRYLDSSQGGIFCVVIDRDGIEVHELAKKKRTRSISTHLDRTSLVNKGFMYDMTFGKIFLRDTASSSERAREPHLASSGSQSQRRIWFILPARGASHIIKEHASFFLLQCLRNTINTIRK